MEEERKLMGEFATDIEVLSHKWLVAASIPDMTSFELGAAKEKVPTSAQNILELQLSSISSKHRNTTQLQPLFSPLAMHCALAS